MQSNGLSRKVLLPLIEDYYLFEYFYDLANCLIKNGFEVVFIAGSVKTNKKIKINCPTADIRRLPFVLSWLNNRNNKLPFRIGLYFILFCWIQLSLKREFKFAIVPWTTKPIWNLISKGITSLTVNNVTNMSVLEDSVDEHKFVVNNKATLGVSIGLLFEKLKFIKLSRVNGKLIRFNGLTVLDHVLNIASIHNENGCNGIAHLCVMGDQYVKNYRAVGVDPEKTEITVTGNPSYEFCWNLKKNFSAKKREKFLLENDLPFLQPIFSFFVSPSSLSVQQLDEIEMAIESIQCAESSAYFVIKLHPKINASSLEACRQRLKRFQPNMKLISLFASDSFNAKIMLCSKAIVQKQSTLGFLALNCRVPILSYNLIKTDYHDDIFEIFGFSFHCETNEEIKKAVHDLNDKQALDLHLQKLEHKEKMYCRFERSPCQNIADLIADKYFD